MSDSDEADILYYIWRTQIKKKQKAKKKMWVRDIFLNRETLGEYHHLKSQLDNDSEKFYDYYHMNKTSYELLVSKVKPLFVIGHTHCRKTISFEERLAVTLRFLTSGESFKSASFRFRISHNHIGVIIHNMLPLIYLGLHKEYLQFPKKDNFLKISKEFEENKGFPNCIGAIEAKQIRIQKQYHSTIILLAIVDAENKFTMIDVGSYGKDSDGVFNCSEFGQLLKNGQLDLPSDSPIDNNGVALPYVFIGDEAFCLTNNLMKPFSKRQLNAAKSYFNYRLSQARQVVEHTFGILVSKFRIFETPIAINPEKIDDVIKAACVLHNFIQMEENVSEQFDNIVAGAFQSVYDLPNFIVETEHQSGKNARIIRQTFTDYFFGAGATVWQDDAT